MHQNVSFGSNGVDRVRSLRKTSTTLRGTKFCTSSARFVVNSIRQPNGPKCTQIIWNVPKHQFRVQWGGSGAFGEKNSDATSFLNFCTSSARFAPSYGNQTVPNAPKEYKTHQNISLWSNGVDRVRSLRKIPMRFHGTNLSINCTGSTHLHRVSCSKETLQNAPKHYETHTNMSFGSNGMDWVRSLRKIPKLLHDTNLCINYTSSTRFATSFV